MNTRARRVGIKDVAGRAGVGIATVSRVFTGSAEVAPATRLRVLEAAEELGYRPDRLAQSLRLGATMSAGFVADDLGNHLNIEIATGAERALRRHRYSLLVMNSEMDPALDAQNIAVLRDRRVDALMMTPVTEDDPGLIAAVNEAGMPVVIVEGDLPGASSVGFVLSDHRSGAASALRHLVELGHRSISVITGPLDLRSARQRALACDDVSEDAGGAVHIRHLVTELSAEGGHRASRVALDEDDPPTAVVVGGDQLLTGVLDVIAAAGLELGRGISLVTSDPVALASVFRPPLATITRDATGLGDHAAEILLRALDDPTSDPEEVILPTRYEPRASVGPAP